MAVPQGDGQPLHEHLAAYERLTGRQHPTAAAAPPLPDDLVPLWEEFLKLHATRDAHLAGPARISYRDIAYYQRVTGNRFTPWEVDVIMLADTEFFKALPKPKAPGK